MLTHWLTTLDNLIWGPPLLLLLMGTGLYLTLRLGLLQVVRLPLALKLVFFPPKHDDKAGDVSSFAALRTALSATIGTGNIVGVALSTEGDCGLDMELPHASRSLSSSHDADRYVFNSNERVWISNQHDPDEARAQLDALRKSVMKLTGETAVNLQLLPGSGRLRTSGTQAIEAVCDAETVLVWSIAASPDIGQLKVWEYNGKEGWHSLPDAQARAREPSARLMRFTHLPVEKAFSLN